MDQKELVEQLTKAVLEKLGKADTTANKSVAGNAAPEGEGGSAGRTGSPVSAQASAGGPRPDSKVLIPSDLIKYIDHTLLKPEATKEQHDKLCSEAKEYNFYSVCVNSSWVEYCAKQLRGSGVKICAVVGFPLGAMDKRAKGFETRHAIEMGADEIDMVINVGALKSGNTKLLEEDIRSVVRATRQRTVVKVIIEAALLTDEEKIIACQLAKNAEADFVKTSTGFSKGGATVKDVALMRRTVGPKMGVKAAGGIRSFEDAAAMIEAGATRLGTSSSVEIVTGKKSSSEY